MKIEEAASEGLQQFIDEHAPHLKLAANSQEQEVVESVVAAAFYKGMQAGIVWAAKPED